MNKECGKVYITDEYDIFKKLYANRQTRKDNIKKLTASMTNNGWVGGPIIVNENMEIVDGQNRLEGAKAANVPVEYLIKPGYGIKECIILNKVSAA